MGVRKLRGAGLAFLWATSSAALAGAQGGDSARAVIAVFPVNIEGVEAIDGEVQGAMTAKLHAVVAAGSGYLTVPLKLIRTALERGGHAAKPGEKSLDELEAIAKAAAQAAEEDVARIEAARDAAEIAPDSHEGRAAHAVFIAEEKAEKAKEEAKRAQAAFDAALAVARAALSGGTCADDDCRAAVGQRVGASRVLLPRFRRGAEGCSFEARFYDLELGLTTLRLEAGGSCDAAGLDAAITTVATAFKARDAAGYDAYQMDLAEGAKIVNPPSAASAELRVDAAAQGDPDERIEVFVNGARAGELRGGSFATTVPHGRYLVVLKSVSNLFSPRRFDLLVDKPVRVPRDGFVTLRPVFGAIEFDLVAGPWRLRTGSQPLVPKEANQVRPGTVPVQLYLEDEPAGELRVVVEPTKTILVRVAERPKTNAEFASIRGGWLWRAWGSLGLALAAGGIGAERVLAAHAAEDRRDTALAALGDAAQKATYQQLRADVVAHDDDRLDAQVLGFSLLGAAGGFALWSAIEWIFGAPDRGALVVPGFEVLPISDTGAEDEVDDKIQVPGGAK